MASGRRAKQAIFGGSHCGRAAVRTWRREGGLSVKTVVQKAGGGKAVRKQASLTESCQWQRRHEDETYDGKPKAEPEVCSIHTIVHC